MKMSNLNIIETLANTYLTKKTDMKSFEILLEDIENGINKMDEQRALQAIRIYLIPKAAELYNSKVYYKNSERVTSDIIRKNLKKNRQNGRGIIYHSEVRPGVVFIFVTRRSDTYDRRSGIIMVHCSGPIGCMMGMYIDDPTNLLEENVGENLSLNKIDESRAVQYIKYRIIPLFVDHVYNRFIKNLAKRQLNREDYPVIGYQTFRNNLKKTVQSENKDEIIYESHITKRFYIIFRIFKDFVDGNIMVSMENTLPSSANFGNTGLFTVKADPPTKLNEVTLDKRPGSISRKEEAEALQFIKINIVPGAVHDLNSLIASGGINTSKEEMSRGLKKTKHETYSLSGEPNRSDIIEYTSHSPGRPNVIFYITKAPLYHQDELENHFLGLKLYVGYSPILGKYGLKSSSSFIVENEVSINKLNPLHDVSRKDEAEAVQFIRRFLIPKLCEDVSGWGGKYDEKTMVDTLRKMRHEDHKFWTDISYMSQTGHPKDPTIWFSIFKNDKGITCVGVEYSDTNRSYRSYRVGDITFGAQDLQEVIQPFDTHNRNKYSISKMEEAYSVDLIKKILIPEFVNFSNKHRKEYTHQSLLDISTVRKTLKKIEQHIHSTGYLREITYQIQIDTKESTIFDIFKNSDGKLMISRSWDGRVVPVEDIEEYLV
jgi:hypothetical protein